MSELLANLLFTRQLIYFERISIERRSEISVLVNTLEKAAQLKFSIRVFGSVYVSGSQTFQALRKPLLSWEARP